MTIRSWSSSRLRKEFLLKSSSSTGRTSVKYFSTLLARDSGTRTGDRGQISKCDFDGSNSVFWRSVRARALGFG